jgi:Holliday junction resolvase
MTSGSSYERELKGLMESDGYYVIRSAGSLAIDLVATDTENGRTIFIEVKSFKGDTFRISKTKETREQFKEMCRLQQMFNGNCSVFYALRKKGQTDYHFVHPSKLSKPYHWNRGEADGEIHST